MKKWSSGRWAVIVPGLAFITGGIAMVCALLELAFKDAVVCATTMSVNVMAMAMIWRHTRYVKG